MSELNELPKALLSDLFELPEAMLYHAEFKPDDNTTKLDNMKDFCGEVPGCRDS